jgi:hypothetical protein
VRHWTAGQDFGEAAGPVGARSRGRFACCPCTTFDLNGNAWRFKSGDRLRIELAQDDAPYVKASTQPSALTLPGVTLQLPVRG